ncbi:hypothetical protein VTK26DRAFT_2224 [Humicola hyalothermophila]
MRHSLCHQGPGIPIMASSGDRFQAKRAHPIVNGLYTTRAGCQMSPILVHDDEHPPAAWQVANYRALGAPASDLSNGRSRARVSRLQQVARPKRSGRITHYRTKDAKLQQTFRDLVGTFPHSSIVEIRAITNYAALGIHRRQRAGSCAESRVFF